LNEIFGRHLCDYFLFDKFASEVKVEEMDGWMDG
jgi:hypothetical protein